MPSEPLSGSLLTPQSTSRGARYCVEFVCVSQSTVATVALGLALFAFYVSVRVLVLVSVMESAAEHGAGVGQTTAEAQAL